MAYGKFKMGKGREISNQGSVSKKKKTIGGGRKIGPVKPVDGRKIGRPVPPRKVR